MSSSPLKKVDENMSTLRNTYHTDEGRAQNRAGQKYCREDIWAERRPYERDDDLDEPLCGDERDEKPKAIKKIQKEDWEERIRAFQKKVREESWAEKRPVDDNVEDEDDDVHGGMNPYMDDDDDDDDDDDKAAKDENKVGNIKDNEAYGTKIENDKTAINNWEKVDTKDENDSEENEADVTTAFKDEKPKAENEEDNSFTLDNEIRIGNIAHSLDIDEMDSERKQDQGNEDDNHDYDDINDDVNDVYDSTMQPLESVQTKLLLKFIQTARVFYPCFQGFMEGRSLLVVYGFYFSPTLPSGPPWNEGHWPRVRHETSVLKVLAPGTTQTLLLFKFY